MHRAPKRANRQTGATGPTDVIDVREMLCAQALALVAQAMERLGSQPILEVLTSAEDVRRDLVVWASERGHDVEDCGEGILRITRA